MASFTPGPWNVQGDGQIWCDDHPIVEKLCRGPWGDVGVDFLTGEESLVHWWGTVATDEAKANANLIAAAPALYEAGAALVENLAGNDAVPDHEHVFVSLGEIRAMGAALAQARGNSI